MMPENLLPALLFCASNHLLSILVCLFIILVTINGWKTRKTYHKYPPGPRGLPFIGYIPFLGSEPYKKLNDFAKTYGNIFSLPMGTERVVILNDWSAFKEVFGSNSIVDRPVELFQLVSNGLGFGSSNGDIWLEQRKFCTRFLKEAVGRGLRWEDQLIKETANIVNSLRSSKGQPVDVVAELSYTFTRSIMTLVFNKRPDVLTAKKITEGVDYMSQAFPAFTLIPLLPYVLRQTLLFFGIGAKRKILQILKVFNETVKDCLQERLEGQDIDDSDSFIQKFSKEMKQNDNAISSGFTDDMLLGNLQAFLLGGGETTRTSLVWLLIAMANNPRVQQEVQRELDGEGRSVCWGNRKYFPYTCAVISESLRFRTTVIILDLHSSNKELDVRGFHLPKGTSFICNTWAVHNDPKFWPEPHVFRPERFLNKDGQHSESASDSYMPFSYGKRRCPGELVARVALFHYFATLMKTFAILPEKGTYVHHGIILGMTEQPTDVKLKFLPRS